MARSEPNFLAQPPIGQLEMRSEIDSAVRMILSPAKANRRFYPRNPSDENRSIPCLRAVAKCKKSSNEQELPHAKRPLAGPARRILPGADVQIGRTLERKPPPSYQVAAAATGEPFREARSRAREKVEA